MFIHLQWVCSEIRFESFMVKLNILFTIWFIFRNIQPNCVYKNLGPGKGFEKIELSAREFATYDIQFADLNQDGRLDVMEANSDEWNVYYLNRIRRE